MKNKKQILQELYCLDPKLKKKEEELLQIIDKLLKSRPQPKIDQGFVQELRSQLLEEAEKKKQGSSFFSFFFSSRVYAPAAAMMVILAVVISASLYIQNSPTPPEKLGYNRQQIEGVGDKAFGSLSQVRTETMDTEGRGEASFGADGAGQLNIAEEAPADSDTSTPGMTRPNLINYEFQYTGGEISLEDIDSPAYKRTKQGLADSNFSRNMMEQLDTGLLDVSRFDSAAVNNIDIRQSREFGYSIYMNLEEGVVGINKNWEQWPNSKNDCRDDDCFRQQQLQPEDVPDDGTITTIARDFIDEFNIDTSNYAEPQVIHNWKKSKELAQDTSRMHIPEEIPVIFPLMIDGKKVYEQSGQPYGLVLEVNIKHNRVAGVRNLVAQKFQSSNYDVVGDADKIVAMAEKGGLQAPYQHNDPTKTVTMKLGEPEIGLVSIMKREEQESHQLFAPAYIFPITERSEQTYFMRDRLVVPATRELYEQEWQKMNSDDTGIEEPEGPEILPHPEN